MMATLVLLTLLLIPGIAASQTTRVPGPEFNPRTPPSSTVPTTPEIVFPVPPPAAARPVQLFELHPLFGVSEEYTDNYNRSVRNKEDNFRSMLSPGMNVRLDAGYLTGQATYTISGFHDTAVDELGYFNAFSGQLGWEATPRLRLSATGNLNQSDAPSQADRLGLRLGRRKFTSSNGSLGADLVLGFLTVSPFYRPSYFAEEDGADTLTHTFGNNFSASIARVHTVTLGYEYLSSETSSTGGPGTASRTMGHQFSTAFSRDLSERATVGISGSYALRDRDLRGPGGQTDFTRWNTALFANYAVPNTIAIRANVGVGQLATDGSDGDPIVTTSSSLSYWFGQAIATIAVERGFSESFSGSQNQGVVQTTGASGSLVYPFTPSLRGQVNTAYRENEFTGIGGNPTPTSGNNRSTRTDKVLSAGIGVSYQILRWLGTSLDYVYTTTDSSDVDGDIVENRVRLSLNFAF